MPTRLPNADETRKMKELAGIDETRDEPIERLVQEWTEERDHAVDPDDYSDEENEESEQLYREELEAELEVGGEADSDKEEETQGRVDQLDDENGTLLDDLDILRAQLTEATEAADPGLVARTAQELAETAKALAEGLAKSARLQPGSVFATASVWTMVCHGLDLMGEEDEDLADEATALLATLLNRTPPEAAGLGDSEERGYSVWLTPEERKAVYRLSGYTLGVTA